MRIDAHQHFWIYNEERDSWITDEMSVIQRNFLPEDLRPVLAQNRIDGTVIVQSDQSKEENIFQLANALKHDFVRGVVGWIDFEADDLSDQLEYYQEFKKLKGFRHVLQGEQQRDFMLRPKFKRGVGRLKDFGYTYDILIHADQLAYTLEFVRAFPDQPFIINHLAKPHIKAGQIYEWKKAMAQIASFENVFCKVSGMVTEADWKQWNYDDFLPYLEAVADWFSPRRLLFGSDWPVCLVAASYDQVVGLAEKYFSTFSKDEQDLIFGKNAVSFYNL
jgi:L-fuconolactonase